MAVGAAVAHGHDAGHEAHDDHGDHGHGGDHGDHGHGGLPHESGPRITSR